MSEVGHTLARPTEGRSADVLRMPGLFPRLSRSCQMPSLSWQAVQRFSNPPEYDLVKTSKVVSHGMWRRHHIADSIAVGTSPQDSPITTPVWCKQRLPATYTARHMTESRCLLNRTI